MFSFQSNAQIIQFSFCSLYKTVHALSLFKGWYTKSLVAFVTFTLLVYNTFVQLQLFKKAHRKSSRQNTLFFYCSSSHSLWGQQKVVFA
mmetsp:Transcript_49830/g.72780  ORF Transcript_49830/g.72780 Transcript_49830/m.72780 type:complete len:89 (+) Transcript_49830:1334-1600(+)